MKNSPNIRREIGLTLVEVLVILAVLAFLFAMLVPRMGPNPKARALRIQCVNNLKQIGQSERIWESDHADKFSFEVSRTNGGTMEFGTGANVWHHFQVLSNGLSDPKNLICPADSDRLRKAATNFSALSNSNLSYFIGLDSTEANPQGILSGDRNITNGTPLKNGILELTTNNPAGWTAETHNLVGNVLLSDGSVQQVTGTGLRYGIINAGTFTNHLQMPVIP